MKLEIMPSSSSNIEVDEYDDGQCDDRPHRLPRVDFDRTMIVGNTNWMRLETLSYLVEDVSAEDDDVGDSGKGGVGGGDMTKGGDGRMRRNTSYRKWDRVVRTTKVSEDSIDAVLILATLRGGVRGGVVGGDDDDDDGDDDLLVCVRQYRPAVDMDVLELPAGLIDTNEDARAAAIRELREETGYVGTPVSSSSSTGTGFGDTILGTYLSPGLTNENACLVRLDVDLNDEENRRVYDAHVAGNDNNNIDDDDGGISMNNNDDIINHMMETSERERMMTTVLLPTTNILDSIHAYLIKEEDKGVGGDVRNKCGIFTGLYHLAVGMHMGNAMMRNRTMKSTGTTNERKKVDDGEEGGGSSSIVISYDEERSSSASSSSDDHFPLVILEFDGHDDIRRRPTSASSHAVTSALRSSGFLLIKTDLLPLELQRRALRASRAYMTNRRFVEGGRVLTHPNDPKAYAMIEGIDSFRGYDDGISDGRVGIDVDDARATAESSMMNDLEDWYCAVRETRSALLRCISVGLGMGDDDDGIDALVRLHDEDNDSLRLLEYFPGDETTGNRCKEHSDYGTLTLLLNDGVSGLEAYVDDRGGNGVGGSWSPVPYVEGYIVVNVGSILSEWTGGVLRATLHRVAGPASVGGKRGGCGSYAESLLRGVSIPRYSIAYFADPNCDVTIDADKLVGDESIGGGKTQMNVLDYILWRSGGGGSDRSGVAFTSFEESRLANIR